MPQITIKVDGRDIKANVGDNLLDILISNGFYVPHMCYNQEMHPYGACRLCLVEIEINGKKKTTTSCSYPVSEGLVVYTSSDVVRSHRKMVVKLLLARCPEVKEIKALAKELGVEDDGSFAKKDEGCILCGLCTRACEYVVGVSAISFVGRGPDKYVSTPFLDESKECIGCGSCVYVCPVNYIKLEEDENVRKLPQWQVEFKMIKCQKCGQKIGTDKEVALLKKRASLPDDWFNLCKNCR